MAYKAKQNFVIGDVSGKAGKPVEIEDEQLLEALIATGAVVEDDGEEGSEDPTDAGNPSVESEVADAAATPSTDADAVADGVVS